MLSPRAPEGWGGRLRPPKMPAMRGLLAPQNTFLDTIATRFDGTRESDLRPTGSQGSQFLPGFLQVPHPGISAWCPLCSHLPSPTPAFSLDHHFLPDAVSQRFRVQSAQVGQNGQKSPGLGPRMPFVGEGAHPDLVSLTHPIPVSGAVLPTTMEVASVG